MSDPAGDAGHYSHGSVAAPVVMSMADNMSADMLRSDAAGSGYAYVEEMSAAVEAEAGPALANGYAVPVASAGAECIGANADTWAESSDRYTAVVRP